MNHAARWLRAFLFACLLATIAGALLWAHPQSNAVPTTIAAASAQPVVYGYDRTLNNERVQLPQAATAVAASSTERFRSTTLHGGSLSLGTSVVAAEGGGARFVVNGAGEALDTARVTIPEGKFGYLLENPSKAGVFADSMGFDQASLDSALRQHLVDNFGNATASEAMVGGGTKFSVTGALSGPSGAKWTITSVWGIDPDGLIRLITATP